MAESSVEIERPPIQAAPRTRYLNRELSQLEFERRILALAADRRLPLLERVRFLAILGETLDEFFQVRVAGLREQMLAGLTTTSPDGMTPTEQLEAIRERVDSLLGEATRLFSADVCPGLAERGIMIVATTELEPAGLDHLRAVFREEIFPVLTPLAVDPAHPFPYISNLSLNLAVMVRVPGERTPRFARVKVPPLLPRFIPLPDGERFVPLEQVISLHLPMLFPGMEIVSHSPFRVTRDADLELVDEEAADLLAAIQNELRRQQRKAQVVRLEVDAGMSDEVLGLLVRELELEATDVYRVDGLLDLSSLWAIYALDRPNLKDEPLTPVTQRQLQVVGVESADIVAALQDGDILVHHP